MSFRRRLLLLVTLVLFLAVGGVSAVVWSIVRRSFERAERERTAALVAQFQKEFERRGSEVAERVAGIATSESVNRMALEFSRAPDYSLYVNEAQPAAATHQLDFLEFVTADGTIISSAQWPARFGYKEAATAEAGRAPFLKREELPSGWALGVFSVQEVKVGDQPLFVVGGTRIDDEFLKTLVLPAGMRTKLVRMGPAHLEPISEPQQRAQVPPAQVKEAELLLRVLRERKPVTDVIEPSSDPAEGETVHAIPLTGADGDVLGVLFVANSRRAYVDLERHIGSAALVAAGLGILLAIVVSGWAAGRVTRPVEQVAEAAREVAAGHWDTQVAVTSHDDIGELAENFNRMTRELVGQRDRALQAERVAAWRELARRLAHELKNPLFPLQITIENLTRARQQSPEQFDEVFRESTTTLLAELSNLKEIIGRFSDFSKMPQPHFQPVDVNELVRRGLKIFEAQFRAAGHPQIEARMEADETLPRIAADPELLHRALSNLILNAMDAMPSGGMLTLRTRQDESNAILEVSDSGSGLTAEECERLFTPYYTSKQHGTGLGLAIVQSVVTDHKGRIAVESAPGKGTTFRIELPKSSEYRVGISE
ncbi:MAG TPA: ATP-binding protein [Terriglobales bacterium]|nr:ATP-binding protein [Terriglobales bacterium]